MNKIDVVNALLPYKHSLLPTVGYASAFASSNIALSKYWGKRDQTINLPMTSSVSISLGKKGTTTKLTVIDASADVIIVNCKPVSASSSFAKYLSEFLDLFRPKHLFFTIEIELNIPIAAGLASSASGFASLILALNQLFAWELPLNNLSILARLGSGSACRSLWPGFVEWDKGAQEDGMDSYGKPLAMRWPGFCLGLLIISHQEKNISSRQAMQHTVNTSPFYSQWVELANTDCHMIKIAIAENNFVLLGETAESNALAMHSTLLSARPAISYFLPQTVDAMRTIWALRQQGLSVYFTQDAGPNLKLLFLQSDLKNIVSYFPSLEVINVF